MLITLEEAKAQLGMEPDESVDDSLISGYIAAAQAHFESQFGIVVDQGERSWSFDRFANLMIIPSTPVDRETIVIAYLDSAGASQAFADFRSVPMGKHVRLLPDIGSAWPATPCADGVVTVTATAGYAADADNSDGVPDDLKVAARMLIAHWFENRESFGSGMSEMPMGVSALLAPYRLMRI